MSLLALVDLSIAQGAPWTEEETNIIKKKIFELCKNPSKVRFWYKNMYPDYTYSAQTEPNARKLLRLGFHDCLTYENPVDGAANGCDGCLNPDGMGINMFDDLGVTKNSQKGPNVDKTNNNGLTFTADILEEIYTNKDFPNGIESLEVSMKESGKSRADLWAFATLVALQYGIDNNNLACQGEPRDACGHLEYGKEGCEVPWPSIPKFKTGRTDCVSPDGAEKPWHTSIDNHEVHPRPHGNGPETVDFYKTNFGLTAREAIALQEGSHSFAKFNAKVSYFQYEWTRAQGHLFNNQVLKHLAERPQYFSNCQSWKTGKKDGFYLTGDYLGQAPNTTWRILYRRTTENGGPFQWHHIYYRCKATNYCSTINEDQSRSESKNIPAIFNRAEPAAVDGCCDDLGEGEYCKPIEDCERWIQNDETAMNCEVGFYLHFDTDEDGKPTGCEGFDEKWLSGKKRSIDPVCGKEEYAPEGEPLYKIVENQADSNEVMMTDFVPAFEKMIENGYDGGSMTEVPETWWFGVY